MDTQHVIIVKHNLKFSLLRAVGYVIFNAQTSNKVLTRI